MNYVVAAFTFTLLTLTTADSEFSNRDRWEEKYRPVVSDEINDYLDDTYQTLKNDADTLNIDPLSLPDSAFKLRVTNKEGRIIYRVQATNQVLTGLSQLKRKNDGHLWKYSKEIRSDFVAVDLEINGEVSIAGGEIINKTCSVFVDIDCELRGQLRLLLPSNKTNPTSVSSLKISSLSRRPYVELQKDCVQDERLRNIFVNKYQDAIRENLGDYVIKKLKEALNQVLKPFTLE